jgi:hypothetical protein
MVGTMTSTSPRRYRRSHPWRGGPHPMRNAEWGTGGATGRPPLRFGGGPGGRYAAAAVLEADPIQ